jgi:hypothetical protein
MLLFVVIVRVGVRKKSGPLEQKLRGDFIRWRWTSENGYSGDERQKF